MALSISATWKRFTVSGKTARFRYLGLGNSCMLSVEEIWLCLQKPLLFVEELKYSTTRTSSGTKLKARARKQSVTDRRQTCMREQCTSPMMFQLDQRLNLSTHLVTTIELQASSCNTFVEVRFMRRAAYLVHWQGPVITLLVPGCNYTDGVCTPL